MERLQPSKEDDIGQAASRQSHLGIRIHWQAKNSIDTIAVSSGSATYWCGKTCASGAGYRWGLRILQDRKEFRSFGAFRACAAWNRTTTYLSQMLGLSALTSVMEPGRLMPRQCQRLPCCARPQRRRPRRPLQTCNASTNENRRIHCRVTQLNTVESSDPAQLTVALELQTRTLERRVEPHLHRLLHHLLC